MHLNLNTCLGHSIFPWFRNRLGGDSIPRTEIQHFAQGAISKPIGERNEPKFLWGSRVLPRKSLRPSPSNCGEMMLIVASNYSLPLKVCIRWHCMNLYTLLLYPFHPRKGHMAQQYSLKTANFSGGKAFGI